MISKESPEPLLQKVIAIDRGRIRPFALRWLMEYLDAGECSLAYDGLVSEIQDGNYVPSSRCFELLKAAAKVLDMAPPESGPDTPS